ncbi:hypothetical protein T552_03471 [Pneumocystis carinii B80]|uniref:N-terminal of MaoC-like dehydratase domain-containing protein n=1 Tax=Pneumocystis carinii (strain B80) TaxID=1408658 RepID=A0A0W4ZB10_PNEC8|nr:hypothetical protein T552_03471 [Pneumocystis carinii B80]KTW25611.1 hypothetical protein T552_03471 [Pneumocystis carinii B80]
MINLYRKNRRSAISFIFHYRNRLYSYDKSLSELLHAPVTYISDFLSPTIGRQLSLTLSSHFKKALDLSRFSIGNELPPGYHYLYFHMCHLEDSLAKDGGEMIYAPLMNWNRRLWAKGSLEYINKNMKYPLRMGFPAISIEKLEKVDWNGRKEDNISVWTCKEISPLDDQERPKDVCLRERICIVYQSVYKMGEKVIEISKKSWIPDFSCSITPSQILLFRYSALTFNSHKIHYDYSYLKEEKYDNLLVQGSLCVVFLLELLQQNVSSDLRLKSFYYKIQYPLYANFSYKFCGRRLKQLSGIQYALWVESDNLLHMKGTAEMW